jgi:glycyl-radical enzyme activating protein
MARTGSGMDRLDVTGIISDIQRGSLHDGPGIRTVVFTKGCPLDCLWCHNPECNSFSAQLFFNPEKCTYCGFCQAVCDQGVHQVSEDRHLVDFQKCNYCGLCIPECPRDALKIIGRKMKVAEVMETVCADDMFYQVSGGGLTLSGGEPMAQFPFAHALLKEARSSGIHTCMETSGFAPQAQYEKILPVTDLFLFDYKATGSNNYRKYTGVEDELILSNLDFLYRHNKEIVLRCPVIPNINDQAGHFQAISALDRKYPRLSGITLLPFHDMGNGKRTGLGDPPTLPGLQTVPPETARGWIDALHEIGCTKAVLA